MVRQRAFVISACPKGPLLEGGRLVAYATLDQKSRQYQFTTSNLYLRIDSNR